jgi:2-oxoglutarate dehydrogenase E2 component (dihydrolipoamide succinyltransferase)
MTAEELRQTRSSPVVRKIAAEHQLDIREIPGTGIGGRVTKQDILGHIEGRGAPPPAPGPTPAGAPAPAAPGAPAPPTAPSAPPAVAGPRVQIVPMSPIRKKTAEHMVLSKRISAHVSTVFEIDFTRIDQLRHKHKASFEERGVRLTYMPFILKAVVDALAAFPVLNASIEGDNVVYRKDVNLGVAVALDWGLIVPVIHHADEKNVLGLARAVNDIAERARAKKLKVEEVQGGTFTVTNPGVFGSLFGTPIINQPQVAILGLGTIEKRPVVRDDAIAIRTMAYVALTFDHRLVDGSDADRFMAQIKKTLQEFDESSVVRPLQVRRLGRVPYARGLELQQELVARAAGRPHPRPAAAARARSRVHARAATRAARTCCSPPRRCASAASRCSRPAAAATSPTTARARWSATRSSTSRPTGATCTATCATSRR